MTEIEQILSGVANRYAKVMIKKDMLGRLIDLGTFVDFSAGELIVAAGDEESKLYLLVEGLIRKYYLDYQGNDLTHQFLEAGQVFSSQHIVFSGQVMCNFEAVEPCRMVCFDYGLVQQLMLEEPLLTHVYIGILEETLRIKLVRETALLTESATERYLKLKAENPTIDQRVNHTHIASYIGVTPVSLSRIRRTLREEN
ncbi:cAMP-binding protein [Enterococcus avium]|uniref:Crp/Fnr family transcriptional regulator n=1 Tax=Enterococcus malodoratus TaxID=71451 RepID=UPI0008AF31B1|nr:Crp/Fnr family transcriptional regulator [Enterococcus malodoratus]BBM16587.1 cAMP-binding protein [Enterococcus avium]SET28157.1 cAMP-binding domain of CRP or a regulatory subunit of cAMP-dependent protein kinases [Enterococcus malodoratus]